MALMGELEFAGKQLLGKIHLIEKTVGLILPKSRSYLTADKKDGHGGQVGRSSDKLPHGLGKIIEDNKFLREHPLVKKGLEVLEVTQKIIAQVSPFLKSSPQLLQSVQTLGIFVAVTIQFINIVIMVETFVEEDSEAIKDVLEYFRAVVKAMEERIEKIKKELQEIQDLFTESEPNKKGYRNFEKQLEILKIFNTKVAICKSDIEECKELIKSNIPKMSEAISNLKDGGTRSVIAASIFAAFGVSCAVATVVVSGGLAAVPAVGALVGAYGTGRMSLQAHRAFAGKDEVVKMRDQLQKYLIDVEKCRVEIEEIINVTQVTEP